MSRNKNIRTRENTAIPNEEQQRKRQKFERTIIEPSESVLWPETDDSFFSDVKLDTILNTHRQQGANKPADLKNNDSFFNNDNSLFSDIVLPHESEGVHSNVGGTPINPILPTSDTGILGDDTLFSEIDVDQIVAGENFKADDNSERQVQPGNSKTMKEADIFENDDFPLEELLMQGTQKFLADVAFKVPKLPEGGGNNNCKTQTNVDCYIAGTQYETRQEIQNRTLNPEQQGHRLNTELRHINRDADENFGEQPLEDFPCMGDFYGLPDRVKRMIFETKGIKTLYGELKKYTKIALG